MNINLSEELIEEFAKGNGAIWLGAGCSTGSGLPTWDGLINLMKDRLIKEDKAQSSDFFKLNYLEIAQIFRSEFGSHTYYSLLRRELATRNFEVISNQENATLNAVTKFINHFAPNPGLTIVSTNFDNLLEQNLLVNHNKIVRKIITPEDIATISQNEDLFVLKPNGDIDNPNSIVLTHQDYLEFRKSKAEFWKYLYEEFNKKTFLFIGYGLGDFTFNQIIGELGYNVKPYKRKSYILAKESSKLKSQVYKSQGVELIPIPDYNKIPLILNAIINQQSSIDIEIKKIELLPEKIKKELEQWSFMFVDDNDINIKILYTVLKFFGWNNFNIESDPQKALDNIYAEKYDFIITDLAMPKISGIELIKKIRLSKLNKDSIICMNTAYSDMKWEALESGADLYITRPTYWARMFKELYYLKRIKLNKY